MFYDANGTPNPNGDFQMVGGRLCVRQGRRVHFDITMMRDSASATDVFLKDTTQGTQVVRDMARAGRNGGIHLTPSAQNAAQQAAARIIADTAPTPQHDSLARVRDFARLTRNC